MSTPATPLHERDIVCVGFTDWSQETRLNQHHLMSRLAHRGANVLFVESLGLRRPTVTGRDLSRIARRVRRGLQAPRAVDGEALRVLSPLVLPLHSLAAARALNARLLPWLVRRAARGRGMARPVLWSYVPQAELLVDALDPQLVVYHCVDDIGAQKGIDAEVVRAAERRFARRADVVFASSPPLAARMREYGGDVELVTNVADVDLFRTARRDREGATDPAVAAIPGPRLVFLGAVSGTKLDLELLLALARAHREWQVVLVGPVGLGDPETDVSALQREPNVHLLGPRRQAQLPEVLRGADVGLIPYRRSELTRSVFPMKVYEYLAAGVPVVSTSLPSLEGVAGVLRADEPEAFAAAVAAGLADRGPTGDAARSALAEGRSWEARLDELDAAIAARGR